VRLERELLRCMLTRPELALQLPIEWVNAEAAEGRCAVAMAQAASQGSGPAGPAAVLERFRETPFESLIVELQLELEKAPLSSDEAALVFTDTARQMRDRTRRARFNELKLKVDAKSASREEQLEYVELVRRGGPGALVASSGDQG